MSFASKTLFTGDDLQTQYTISFPFINVTHVWVFVNDVLQLNPAHYTISGSQVTFATAPGSGAAIELQRNTSPNSPLVTFVDGSVLNDSDLNTAFLQNFYLQQETTDSFNEVINEALINVATGAGIIVTDTDEVIAALVNEMLSDAAAANLLSRIDDIDFNAESVLEVQTDVTLMGVSNGTDDAFIFDSQTVKIDSDGGDTFAERFTALVAATATAQAAVATEATARADADSAEAALRVTLAARVTTNEGDLVTAAVDIASNVTAITDAETGITNLEARYGVTLNVNDYITGFLQNNDGNTGSFLILADKFGVVTPSTIWVAATAYTVGQMRRPIADNGRVFKCTTAGTSHATTEPTWDTGIGNTTNDNDVVWTTFDDLPFQPFLIDGSKIIMNGDVEINGSLMLNGTIIGAALVAGTIGTTQIGANAITTDQLNANAVTAAKIQANTITAGKLNVGTLSAISADIGTVTGGIFRGGQTAYDTGTGFWLGFDGATPKFSIGDSGNNSMTWDGSTLTIKGSLAHTNVAGGNGLIVSLVDSNENTATYIKKKSFLVGDTGTIRCHVRGKRVDDVGSVPGVRAGFQCKIGAAVKATREITTDGFLSYNEDFAVVAGDIVDVWIRGADSTFPTSNSPCDTKNIEIRTLKFVDELTLDIA